MSSESSWDRKNTFFSYLLFPVMNRNFWIRYGCVSLGHILARHCYFTQPIYHIGWKNENRLKNRCLLLRCFNMMSVYFFCKLYIGKFTCISEIAKKLSADAE